MTTFSLGDINSLIRKSDLSASLFLGAYNIKEKNRGDRKEIAS